MDHGIGSWITKRALRNGEACALVGRYRRSSFQDLEERTNQIAHLLRSVGVRRGDRVALLLENSIEFIEVMFATAKLGAITVPINFRLSGSEVSYILADSGAMVLVTSGLCGALALDAAEVGESRISRIFEVLADDRRHEGWVHLENALEGHSMLPIDSDISGSEVAAIMYTSGTTGRPKGAMLTHDNFLWNVINFLGEGMGIGANDVTVTAAPMFHIGGLGVFTLPLIYLGGTSVILDSFTPRSTLQAIAAERATVMFLVPAMWAAIASSREWENFDTSTLKLAVAGGSPCPLPVIDYFISKGLQFQEGFGMTETAPGCTMLDAAHVRTKAGSIGRPLMHVEARIVDDNEVDCGEGVVGELIVRGPNIFVGYWCLPNATAEAFRSGWFHTGDLGRADGDGFLTLVDRKKDMIISGGENVYPIEVEQVLFRHPWVADAAVIGLPDDSWGEVVTAVVVPTAGVEFDPAEVIAFARTSLGGFKCPKSIIVVEELPRNATGKLLKRALREQYAGRQESFSR